MRLAVIIPSYNHAHYIGAALESVLSQTRRPDRILVIDDGSKDDSVEVIRRFAGRGVEGSARENRGAHSTLNELVDRASEDCDVISILNSDDHYHPSRFEKCLPLLEADPDKQVVVSAVRVMDGHDADIDPAVPTAKWFRAVWSMAGTDHDPSAWLGMANFPATTSNVIARASWLKRFPFRPYRFSHDYYFLAQSVLRQAMLVHPEALVNYRVHGSNTMNTAPAPLLREMLRMNFDLAHDLGPELPADAGLRERYARYCRAQWDSVSSFHAGLYQALMAGAAARMTDEEIRQATDALTEAGFPELAVNPNLTLIDEWSGTAALVPDPDLPDKYKALKVSEKDLKSRNRAQKELAALRGRMTESRWLGLGRALGVWKPPVISKSAAAPDPAGVLLQSLERHPWVRLGRRFGAAGFDDPSCG
ncbi:MAG: glycosyltransferase family 2 protein [Verrucomicrobiota bacterium]